MSIERKECETLSLSDDNEVALQKKISNSISQKKYSVGRKSKIIFMFPGQGSDYKYMGKQLYESQDVFKKHLEFHTAVFPNIYKNESASYRARVQFSVAALS